MSAPRNQEEVEGRDHLRPDLALLLDAMRMENKALLDAGLSKMTNKILMLGVPLGAVGGFAAELVKPGVVSGSVEAMMNLFRLLS